MSEGVRGGKWERRGMGVCGKCGCGGVRGGYHGGEAVAAAASWRPRYVHVSHGGSPAPGCWRTIIFAADASRVPFLVAPFAKENRAGLVA